MSIRASKRIQRTIKETREWLTERPPVLEQQLAFLNEDLEGGTLQGLTVATITLGVLASYYSRKGTIGVIDGEVFGWDEIHKGLAYHYWCLKIQAQRFFKTAFLQPVHAVSGLDMEACYAACLYGYCLASGNEAGQHYTIDVLRGIATVPGAVSAGAWERSVFEPFMLRLHQKQETFDLPEELEQRDLGPYAGVLAHWDAPERLAEVLDGVCEYHCANMVDSGRKDRAPEFYHPPFDLLPCEVLGIYALRQKLGLETPAIDHPLLATPLASVPVVPGFITDEVLTRVEAAYTAVFE
jgi:hypothetical protein